MSLHVDGERRREVLACIFCDRPPVLHSLSWGMVSDLMSRLSYLNQSFLIINAFVICYVLSCDHPFANVQRYLSLEKWKVSMTIDDTYFSPMLEHICQEVLDSNTVRKVKNSLKICSCFRKVPDIGTTCVIHESFRSRCRSRMMILIHFRFFFSQTEMSMWDKWNWNTFSEILLFMIIIQRRFSERSFSEYSDPIPIIPASRNISWRCTRNTERMIKQLKAESTQISKHYMNSGIRSSLRFRALFCLSKTIKFYVINCTSRPDACDQKDPVKINEKIGYQKLDSAL